MKLVDTSVVVDIDRGGVDEQVARLDEQGTHAVSIVTLTELRLGVNLRSEPDTDAHREGVERLERLVSRFDVIDVSRSVAVAAADIIAELRRSGNRLDDLHDVYVAATARNEQLPVLTANVDHFERVTGVDVIDWSDF